MYVDVSDMSTDEFADQKAKLENSYEFTELGCKYNMLVTHFLYEETSASSTSPSH